MDWATAAPLVMARGHFAKEQNALTLRWLVPKGALSEHWMCQVSRQEAGFVDWRNTLPSCFIGSDSPVCTVVLYRRFDSTLPRLRWTGVCPYVILVCRRVCAAVHELVTENHTIILPSVRLLASAATCCSTLGIRQHQSSRLSSYQSGPSLQARKHADVGNGHSVIWVTGRW